MTRAGNRLKPQIDDALLSECRQSAFLGESFRPSQVGKFRSEHCRKVIAAGLDETPLRMLEAALI